MSKQTYLKLPYDEIRLNYPKSLTKITEWLANREDMRNGFEAIEGAGDKYKDQNEFVKLVAQIVPPLVQHDPRKLYEIFDDLGVRISVGEHVDSSDENPLFSYRNNVIRESHSASNRQDAEYAAFMEAFKLLEQKLSG
jgi:hypothetical protein